MTTATDAQIATAAHAAGFSGKDWTISVAVALAESSGRTDAVNPAGAYGEWQIFKPSHPELFRAYRWSDLGDNAKMAHAVWAQAGRSWHPWVAYMSGAYLMYMPRARKVTGDAAGGTTTAQATNVSFSATDPLSLAPLADFASFIANPHNWLRLTMFAAGGGLVLLAVLRATGADVEIAKAAKTAAKTAGEVAVMA